MKTKLILIAFAVLLLLGCKPIKEIQYVDRYHEVLKTDSVYKYEKDTMYLTRNLKGDTVYVNRISTKIDYKYKYLNKTDTVTNTNTITKTVTEFKEKKVTRMISWIDWGLILAAFGYLVYRLLKLLK